MQSPQKNRALLQVNGVIDDALKLHKLLSLARSNSVYDQDYKRISSALSEVQLKLDSVQSDMEACLAKGLMDKEAMIGDMKQTGMDAITGIHEIIDWLGEAGDLIRHCINSVSAQDSMRKIERNRKTVQSVCQKVQTVFQATSDLPLTE